MITHSFATFWVGGLLLGVVVEQVQEVLHDQEITPVPLAHSSVLGLLNLRGQLATAVDGRHRLGLARRAEGEPEVHFIIRTEHEPVSLVVDRESEVMTLAADDFEEVPETVSPTIRGFVTGACKLDGTLLLALDANRLLSVTAS